MTATLLSAVMETAGNPGLSSFILDGAVSGCWSFAQANAQDGQVYYFADDGSQAEWGIGTLNTGSPNTLARTTVLGTTAGTTVPLNFEGLVTIRAWPPAARTPLLNNDGTLSCADASTPGTQRAVNARSMHTLVYGRSDMAAQFVTQKDAPGQLIASRGSQIDVLKLPQIQLIFGVVSFNRVYLTDSSGVPGDVLKLSSFMLAIPTGMEAGNGNGDWSFIPYEMTLNADGTLSGFGYSGLILVLGVMAS
ncbi:hypothetical protein S101468_01353 [Acetobacter pasteurianus subsp. pasteurianus]|uniref:Uncharacterized protein n=1 Tax=Acetobacter pasteurianus subsp. pasteurianus TaxID=481145 RepID=A0AAC9STL4_ACEPA|nr:hypothetical protein [Acetobacter pasteurianus]ASC05611.1 hypothetical protein S101468_01353 [Acetobacter pasteurianus subsp. pasteurianus]